MRILCGLILSLLVSQVHATGLVTNNKGHFTENLASGHDIIPVICVDSSNNTVPCTSLTITGGAISATVTSSVLPTGASTEATLAALNAKIPASPATDAPTVKQGAGSLTVVPWQIMGVGSPTALGANLAGPFYASITYTAIGAAANGLTIASAIASRNTVITAWGISTDTAARLTLHFSTGAAGRSNGTTSNIIGGGLYPANGGESKSGLWMDSNAQNTQVSLDASAACTNVECWVEFYKY